MNTEKKDGYKMKVTAICNLKGGVAKTTTAINMAAILAADYDKTVLVIDGDSQCNTTEFLTGENLDLGTLADGLRNGASSIFLRKSNVKGVDLVPGDESLMDLDLSKVEVGSIKIHCLSELKGKYFDKYDFCIIDCPPAFNAAAAAALLAADDVVIPIKLDAFSLRGMSNLMRQIQNMRQLNPSLKIAGLLPTMSYKSANIQDSIDTLRAHGLPVFSAIRRTPKVDDMTFSQRPIIESSPRSAAALDYRQFVTEYVGGENNGL